MKRNDSRPMIFTLPTYEMRAVRRKPRILPFPVHPSTPTKPSGGSDDLSEVRDRLFRMIVAKHWNRSHGHRAS